MATRASRRVGRAWACITMMLCSVLFLAGGAGAASSGGFDSWDGIARTADVTEMAALPGTGHLLLTMGPDDADWPNHLLAIDPTTMDVLEAVALLAKPRQLAVSPDGTRAYVSYINSTWITEVDLSDWSVARSFNLGHQEGYPIRASEIAVFPLDPEVIVVNRVADYPFIPRNLGLAVYNRGSLGPLLPHVKPHGLDYFSSYFEFVSPHTMYATAGEAMRQITLDEAGLTSAPLDVRQGLVTNWFGAFDHSDGHIYFDNIGVVNEIGPFMPRTLPAEGVVEADRDNEPVYMATLEDERIRIHAIDRRSLTITDSFTLPYQVEGRLRSIERVGSGLAVLLRYSGQDASRVAYIGPDIPGAATTPHSLAVATRAGEVTLSWSAPPESALGYLITSPHLSDTEIEPHVRSITFDGLSPNTIYEFSIHALAVDGFSGAQPFRPAVPIDNRPAGCRLLEANGTVHAFGAAAHYGNAAPANGWTATSLATTPTGNGYVVLDASGEIHSHGDAPTFPKPEHTISIHPDYPPIGFQPATAVSVTPTGRGVWIFRADGTVTTHGDAKHLGDLKGVPLSGPIVASIPTPTGNGYYMLGSDGGVFAFGDARFHGSIPGVLPPGTQLNCPIVGLVPTPTNNGYWLVACDGGVFAFGDATFVGSLPGIGVTPNRPVNGLVAFGNGYLMVAADGGVFQFGNASFFGSLGATPPNNPIVGIQPHLN